MVKWVGRSCLLTAWLACPWGTVAEAQSTNPDLTVSVVDVSGLTTDAQSLSVAGSVAATVANVGEAPTGAAFDVVFFEDANGNGTFDSGTDALLAERTVSDPLVPGAELTVDATVASTVLFAGNLIYAYADPAGAVSESNEANNGSSSGATCEYRPPAGGFAPVLEWAWTASEVEPTALNVMMSPAVADINGDGIPDVVFASTASTSGGHVEVGFLRAVNGANGTELFTVSDPALRVNTASSVAVGDIDLDGQVEIIACAETGLQLIAFSNTGALKWRSPNLVASVAWGAPSIANLDGPAPVPMISASTSTPEIVIGRQVLDGATGAILWTGAGGSGTQGTGPLSLVADINLDGSPEIVAGNTAYAADGTILWTAGVPDGYDAVANFDDDAFPEIVHVSGGLVRLLEHDGTVKWGPVAIPGGGVGGPPTVEDYDGDGQAEIGVAGASRYAVFETDGTLKWSAVTQDGSSNRTGSSVFDFEGDGAAEVVYHDELKLRVYRGTDGAVLFETPSSSCTWHEYPLVADVDADGNAEIVTVANNNCGFGAQRGVFVYGDSLDRWVATRQIWNQHTYHITNINDDASVPDIEDNNWQQIGLNNYRTQEPVAGNPFVAPDLTASFLRADEGPCPTAVGLTVRLGNGGANVAAAPVSVAFYDGDPTAGGVLLGVATSTVNLNPGEFEDVSLAVSPPLSGTHTICALADDNGSGAGAFNECNEDNNRHCFALEASCNEEPRVSCVGGEICNDAGQCSASVACEGIGTCVDPDDDVTTLTCEPAPPYAVGSTDVTVTCDDGQGGITSAQCMTVVNDCEPPVCTAPPPIKIKRGHGHRHGFQCRRGHDDLEEWLALATATDNCSVESFTNDAPAELPRGVTVVTWTATDASGNTGTCSSTVTIGSHHHPKPKPKPKPCPKRKPHPKPKPKHPKH